MKTLSVRELRAALPRLESILEQEGDVAVVRRGRPIARLSAIRRMRTPPSHRRLRREMPKMAEGSETLVRRDRDDR